MNKHDLSKIRINQDKIKRKIKRSLRSITVFLLFDVGTILYSIIITIYLWITIEVMFSYISFIEIPKIYHDLGQSWETFIFGLLHVFILLASILMYYSTSHSLANLNKILKEHNLEYKLHSTQWDHVYLAVLSTALSFYFLSIIILLAYATEPNKLNNTFLMDQATYSLLIITYIPLTLQIWKSLKIKAYIIRAKKQFTYLISKETQKTN